MHQRQPPSQRGWSETLDIFQIAFRGVSCTAEEVEVLQALAFIPKRGGEKKTVQLPDVEGFGVFGGTMLLLQEIEIRGDQDRRRSPMMTQVPTISDRGPSSTDSVLRPSRPSDDRNTFHSGRRPVNGCRSVNSCRLAIARATTTHDGMVLHFLPSSSTLYVPPLARIVYSCTLRSHELESNISPP